MCWRTGDKNDCRQYWSLFLRFFLRWLSLEQDKNSQKVENESS